MLEVKDLCKSFKNIYAVDHVNFTLDRGETLVIIGQSGSGKTTLLRMLNGLETPTSGEISGGTFGLVFQDFNLFPQYTALGNLMLAPRLLRRDYRKVGTSETSSPAVSSDRNSPGSSRTDPLGIEAYARQLLEKVGLGAKADDYPDELSGGQKQRVAIARALMLGPDVLCFDEPTSALDPQTTSEMVEILRQLKKEQAMIIVTHNMDVCAELADKKAVMQDGRLSFDTIIA
ncbi:MAG: ATP-binding cassette domain-containing protein [Lachnospiraceae bacterium]|jgi:polar amino acid transport system ATP-binding protein|nr:ATP-binding cassette domain-containing protein [Lachnospiraceae bacterium]